MDVFSSSYLRANIISWLPIQKTDYVLYFGSQEGPMAAKLMEFSDHVTCILPEDIKVLRSFAIKFDYMFCIGLLALLAQNEAKRALAGEKRLQQAVKVLQQLKNYLSERGRLILAAENSLGLKYFAGAKEEGSKDYFAGIEGSELEWGYTRRELQQAFAKAGFPEAEFYYPFPDYRFTMSLYSDDYLPKQGELIDHVNNFDDERMSLFDEGKAADHIIREGRFPEFSNSFLVSAASTKEKSKIQNEEGEWISFVKFSNDRGKIYNIKTFVTKSEDGTFHLLKFADGPEADQQIANMEKSHAALEAWCAGTRFAVNRLSRRNEGAELEYLYGHTMEEELDEMLENGNYEGACKRLLEVIKEIRRSRKQKAFALTDEFMQVFGNPPNLPADLKSAPVSDIDITMANILIQEKTGQWIIIDYEWVFHFPIPLNFIIYRALHYYVNTTAKRRVLEEYNLFEKAGITESEMTAYRIMEDAFQYYVVKEHMPLRQLYREYGRFSYHISSLIHVFDRSKQERTLQIYFDRGEGTKEDDSVFFGSQSLDGQYRIDITLDPDVREVRIDPEFRSCTVEIRQLHFDISEEEIIKIYGPMHEMGNQVYLFDKEDPYFLVCNVPKEARRLLIDMKVETISKAAAEWIVEAKRMEAERMEAERMEAERMEAERIAAEKAKKRRFKNLLKK